MIASEMENIFKVWGKCTSKSEKDQYSFLTEMRVRRSVYVPCPHFLGRYKYRGKRIFVNVDFRRKSTNFDTFNLLLIVFKRCLVI